MSYDVGDGAVVQVIARTASIAIRTWNRSSVRMEWTDGAAFVPSRSRQEARRSYLITSVSVQEERAPGEPAVTALLLPEDFPVPKVAPGKHDVVRIAQLSVPAQIGRPAPPADLTVTIPETTGLVNIRSGRGTVTLTDYHGTTVAAAGRGRVNFNNVSGDAFVQPLNGDFYALDSTFDRLRIRSNRGDEVFDACRVKQIDATTLSGNIIFDNGIFDSGLARFESVRGSIAIGVNGGAQLGAHTQDGQVLTALPAAPPAPVLLGRSDADAVEVAGDGGPLVNAFTTHGNVLLYDGSLADRHPDDLSPPWRQMFGLFMNHRPAGHAEDAVARGRQFARTAAPQTTPRRPAGFRGPSQ
jgi:hypothetical protein